VNDKAVVTTNKALAASFQYTTDGRLRSSGLLVGVSSANLKGKYAQFARSSGINMITSKFSGSKNGLIWTNTAFKNGVASFCVGLNVDPVTKYRNVYEVFDSSTNFKCDFVRLLGVSRMYFMLHKQIKS